MKYYSQRHIHTAGQAMMLAVLFFLAISLTIVLGVATPILRQVKNANHAIKSKEAYFLAEGAMEDALYRVKTGKQVSSGDTVVVNGYTSTITITTTSSGKTIETVTNRDGLVRKMQAKVTAGAGIAFNYGLQTGVGGFIMSNNAGVQGNVYSNGDITGASGTYITGTAIAANSAAATTDQTNGVTGTPPNSINFRNTTATQDIAQSFQLSTTGQINKLRFYIKKTNSPSNATVKIATDSAGSPSSTYVDTATLGDTAGAAAITANYSWVDATFSSNVELTAGTTYWVVIDNGSNSTSAYYTVAANSLSYSSGQAKIGQYNGTWNNTSPSDLDVYFDIYLGGLTSTISNVIVGTGIVGDAHANTVTTSTVRGMLKCKTGSGNNKSCVTTYDDPVPQGFSISEGNIDAWKDEAEVGGTHSGDYTVSSSVAYGPKRITGNLIVNNGAQLTVNGTLWVEGNITLDNGAIVRLSSGYGTNSGVILADGRIKIQNNSTFQGSGQAGSNIMALTTSDCPISSSCSGAYALDVQNNAGAVILNAQKGTLYLSNNAGAKEATAYKIIMDNNAYVIYESGLVNTNFSSGPSGGWNVSSWKEVQ